MPVYEYAHDEGEPEDCAAVFEAMQPMADDPLETCPECGRPCHRVLTSFGVVGKERELLSDKNLESKGFTKYVKAGDGTYEKTAGDGPDVIARD